MSTRLATRLAWSFGILFILGVLLVAGFAYYELVLEPRWLPGGSEPLATGVIEIAAEALALVLVLSFVGWWLARRALRPVELLAAAAERIHEGNLAERIEMPGSGAEFEKLAGVFNAMTARLDASFQRVRQFTLEASHEMKTPLSILRAQLERQLDDPARSEADRAAIASHLHEIERLVSIVDGLTFLSKADAHLVPLHRGSVDLKRLVLDAAADTEVLGAERGIKVDVATCDECMVEADGNRLRQLLVILCDNAVKYNCVGGSVSMLLERDKGDAVIRITNTGDGIPCEDQPRVFDRFYRGALSRGSGIEGCGLGLSIAHWIVTEHGGALSITSTPERTEFVVRLRA